MQINFNKVLNNHNMYVSGKKKRKLESARNIAASHWISLTYKYIFSGLSFIRYNMKEERSDDERLREFNLNF